MLSHLWECLSCKTEQQCLPDDYAEIGTPVCPECEEDMTPVEYWYYTDGPNILCTRGSEFIAYFAQKQTVDSWIWITVYWSPDNDPSLEMSVKERTFQEMNDHIVFLLKKGWIKKVQSMPFAKKYGG